MSYDYLAPIGTSKNPRYLPLALNIYGASDYATMEPKKGKKEPDYTEHGVIGLDPIGDMYFLDWWRGQNETDVGIENMIRLQKKWKPKMWWYEDGNIEKAIGPAWRKRMRELQSFTTMKGIPSITDKGSRLQAFHARASAGTVHGPINAPWWQEVMTQLVKFPAGRWDDGADVCGLLGRGIDEMFDARPRVDTPRPTLVPFTGKWLETNRFPEKPTTRYF